MHKCEICSHPDREIIEAALFKMPMDNSTETLLKIAQAFDVSVESLQNHFLMHSSFESDTSIVRQIKMREADMLAAVALDQMETIKVVGKRMRRYANVSDEDDIRFEKILSKPLVDLYVGAGESLRKTVQTLTEINQLLNGPKDDGSSGLDALAQVISASRNYVKESDHD